MPYSRFDLNRTDISAKTVTILSSLIGLSIAVGIGFASYREVDHADKRRDTSNSPDGNQTLSVPELPIDKSDSSSSKPDSNSELGIYGNDQYGFEFKYPPSIVAESLIDHTRGQIPVVAGFGYKAETGDIYLQYASIIVWTGSRREVWKQASEDFEDRISQRLYRKSTLALGQDEFWIDPAEERVTAINGFATVVQYAKEDHPTEGKPFVQKQYFIRTPNAIFQIQTVHLYEVAGSRTAEEFLVVFDQIVNSMRFAPFPQE